MPFVREFVERTGLGGRRFIVQGDEYIRCDEVMAFETARHSLSQVEFVRRLLGGPAGNDAVARRIFLVRRPASGRTIENMEAVEEVCHRFGFQTVMTEGMSLEQQIRLFSETRYLVAVHGAGLTNMMFRLGAPLSVLEIFPAASYHGWDGPSPHYFWMAQALGFEYDALFGDGAPDGMYRTPFSVDPDRVTARLISLCG
jgi:capsular polysaccharide biosynthesis protein